MSGQTYGSSPASELHLAWCGGAWGRPWRSPAPAPAPRRPRRPSPPPRGSQTRRRPRSGTHPRRGWATTPRRTRPKLIRPPPVETRSPQSTLRLRIQHRAGPRRGLSAEPRARLLRLRDDDPDQGRRWVARPLRPARLGRPAERPALSSHRASRRRTCAGRATEGVAAPRARTEGRTVAAACGFVDWGSERYPRQDFPGAPLYSGVPHRPLGTYT